MSTALGIAFALSAEMEASAPPERRGIARDGVRMLVTERANGANRDAQFRDLPHLLRRGDLVVVNDSATLASAVAAARTSDDTLTVHFSARIAERLWIVEPRSAVARGECVDVAGGGTIRFLAPLDETAPRLWYAAVDVDGGVPALLERAGKPIQYRYVRDEFPLEDYQTMFARVPGSAEMPSASRPFTPAVVRELGRSGVDLAAITLHAGVSSLERAERPFAEAYAVSASTAEAVNRTRSRGGRIVAAGTTVVRALETAAESGIAIASAGWTELIVTADHELRAVDALITGFHEPQASHLDMLAAFLPPSTLAAAYDRAVRGGYLWHEFGDVHLIL